MKLNCLLLDDEPLAMDVLTNYIGRLDDLHLVASCRTVGEANSCLRVQPIDLLFLDIMMPDMNGLDFAKSLSSQGPMIVFTTASREFAVQSYEARAIDYLLKPVRFERFVQAVNRAFDRKKELFLLHGPKDAGTLLVKADNKTYRIHVSDICYIESIRDHVVIYLEDQSPITAYTSIAALEAALPPNDFLRIHRSFLVACQKVKSFSSTAVELANQWLPIGRTHRDEAVRVLGGEAG